MDRYTSKNQITGAEREKYFEDSHRFFRYDVLVKDEQGCPAMFEFEVCTPMAYYQGLELFYKHGDIKVDMLSKDPIRIKNVQTGRYATFVLKDQIPYKPIGICDCGKWNEIRIYAPYTSDSDKPLPLPFAVLIHTNPDGKKIQIVYRSLQGAIDWLTKNYPKRENFGTVFMTEWMKKWLPVHKWEGLY